MTAVSPPEGSLIMPSEGETAVTRYNNYLAQLFF